MVSSSRIMSCTKHQIDPLRHITGVQWHTKPAIKNIFYRQNSLYLIILMPSSSRPPLRYVVHWMHLVTRVCAGTSACCHLCDRVRGGAQIRAEHPPHHQFLSVNVTCGSVSPAFPGLCHQHSAVTRRILPVNPNVIETTWNARLRSQDAPGAVPKYNCVK